MSDDDDIVFTLLKMVKGEEVPVLKSKDLNRLWTHRDATMEEGEEDLYWICIEEDGYG